MFNIEHVFLAFYLVNLLAGKSSVMRCVSINDSRVIFSDEKSFNNLYFIFLSLLSTVSKQILARRSKRMYGCGCAIIGKIWVACVLVTSALSWRQPKNWADKDGPPRKSFIQKISAFDMKRCGKTFFERKKLQ